MLCPSQQRSLFGDVLSVYLVNRVNDPIDPGITTNGFVLRVNQDDFEVFVCGILIDPIGIEHTQIRTTSSNTLLGSGLQGPLVLELIHSLIGWFA